MDIPDNSEARRSENIAVFNANRKRIIDQTTPSMTQLITQNREVFEQESQLSDEDIEIGARWLSEILFGIHVAYGCAKIPTSRRNYQFALYDLPNSSYPQPSFAKAQSSSEEILDDPELLGYLVATLEYSALGMKKAVAQSFFNQNTYAHRLNNLMVDVADRRKSMRPTESGADEQNQSGSLNVNHEPEVTFATSSRGQYAFNPKWLTALIKEYNRRNDPDLSIEASGVIYSNMNDAMFFIGVEEGAHFIKQMDKSFRLNESDS